MLRVLLTSPDRIVFSGEAQSVLLPGEQGVFEVLPLHRPLVSKLVRGVITVDGRGVRIERGVMRVSDDVVTAVIEVVE